MGLVITLKKRKTDTLFAKVSLAMASEGYKDLQNSYGFLMRKNNLLDTDRALAMIIALDVTKESNDIIITLEDALLLITAFDITLKLLRSNDPFRFFHAFENDKKKRLSFKVELITFCNEMITELSEQAIFRGEIEEHKMMLKDYSYN